MPVSGTGFFLCLVLATVLLGCAGTLSRQWSPPFKGMPVQHQISSVPFFPQTDYQCGPASLAMTLVWSGVATDPDKLAAAVYTPSLKGSLQPAMIGAARRHGRVAYVISSPEELLAEVAAGHPVIVLQNLGLSWAPVWHYAVVIGYDADTGVVTLHSGETNSKETAMRVFDNTWSRSSYWGLLTLPPDRLPATAAEATYADAVLGLEKARRWPEAIQGYHTAIEKWPDNFHARMGIGNAYYAMGDLPTAERSFAEAARQFPTEGATFNNLAQVLFEQGKKKAALAAAEKAVSMGGPMSGVFQETLEEIKSSLNQP
ncbi:MAG: peptidase C39 [Deltaproteobacteria bacterium]|nr:MAG: peptidase C39 [Deltaproteobacteria bacterium]